MRRVLVALLLGVGLLAVPPGAAARAACAVRELNLVAHHDDDLLFLNPAISGAIRGGACVRTVFLVASDYHDDGREAYVLARERGVRAAYARMAGLPASGWSAREVRRRGHRLTEWTLGRRVSLLEVRLPDNASSYGGLHPGSMRALYDRGARIPDFDRANTYDRADLTATLAAELDAFRPQVVRTLDPSADLHGGTEYTDFHHDHVVAARLAGDAAAASAVRPRVLYYRDYVNRYAAPNLPAAAIADKLATFRLFAEYDDDIPPVTKGFYFGLTGNQYPATAQSLLPWRPGGLAIPEFQHARLTAGRRCLAVPDAGEAADPSAVVLGACGRDRFTLVGDTLKIDRSNECVGADGRAVVVTQCTGEPGQRWAFTGGALRHLATGTWVTAELVLGDEPVRFRLAG